MSERALPYASCVEAVLISRVTQAATVRFLAPLGMTRGITLRDLIAPRFLDRAYQPIQLALMLRRCSVSQPDNSGCDALITAAQFLRSSLRADGRDCSLPGQGKRSRVIIYLSAQVECASRVDKTASAGGYKGEFVVVEYTWDWCRGQGSGERTRNTVAVGPCKYIAADIGQVADIEDEFRRSVEAAQLHRIAAVDGFRNHVALVQRHSRNDCTRDNPVERDLVAG
jgi:hypothetical protein